jgi:predicted nuclease with TOPRIM domain
MLDWLTRALSQISPEGFVSGTLALLAAIVRILGAVMEARTTREFKHKVRSIPPSDFVAPDREGIEQENERLRGDLCRLQWRIDELETQLTEVGRDHGHTARALTHERDECDRLRVRIGELKDELSKRRSSPSVDNVYAPTAIDDRPTPKMGTRKVRR